MLRFRELPAHRISDGTGPHNFSLHAHVSIGKCCIFALHFNTLTIHLDHNSNRQRLSLAAISTVALYPTQPTPKVRRINIFGSYHTFKDPAISLVIHSFRLITRAISAQVLHQGVLYHQRRVVSEVNTIYLISSPRRLCKPSAHAGVSKFFSIWRKNLCTNDPEKRLSMKQTL